MRVHGVVGLVCASALLSACSTGIKITRIENDDPVLGTPWNLAMTQFAVTITRHVTECGAELKGTVEVIATPSAVLDVDQRYVLESNGWWATSDITSTLAANGTSTGLNAQSTDATAKVISNVVGAIGQVAIGAVAGAAPIAPAAMPGAFPVLPPPPVEACSDKLASAVKDLYPPKGGPKGLKAIADDKIADVAAATAKVVLLTQQAAIDKSYKRHLVVALGQQQRLQAELADAQRALEQAVGTATHTQTLRWPLSSRVFRADFPISLDIVVLDEWLKSNQVTMADAKVKFDVYLALYRPNSTAQNWAAPEIARKATVPFGVPVRLAQVGRLLACVEEACPPSLSAFGSARKNRIQFDQVVLQLGQMYTVPLSGGSFRSQAAVIAMDANGLPTSIQIAEKSAAAEGLSGAAQDVATQFAALPGQISAAKLAATTAQTSQLTAEAGQINAQAALAAAQINAGTAGQTAPLVAQTALINAQNALVQARAAAGAQQTLEITAQTAMMNAQASLITAQANATTGPAIGALTAQTTLINAQTAQVNATAALAKAQVAVALP